jgi:ankyrin repeat protein
MPKKLDEAFQVTIDRIQRQASAKSKQGMEVLKWTFMAERPLSVAELRHALAAVDSTSSSHLDHNDLPFEKSLTDHCHGLVVLDKETSSLRLVHKSLQDFLQKQHEKKKLFETGHSEIARACLLYMGFSDRTMSSGPLYYPDISDPTFVELVYRGFDRPDILEATSKNLASPHIERFPLLKYAIHFWGFHAKKQMNQEVTDQIHTLFLNGRNSHCISKDLLPLALEIFSDSALRTMIGVNIGGNFTRFYSDLTAFPGLYITVHFGLDGVFDAIVDRIHDIDIDMAFWKAYCLQTGILMGHPSIICLLLGRTDVDINSAFANGITPLCLAIEYGKREQEAIVLLLLDRGADISMRCSDSRGGLTPLSHAAAKGFNNAVLRILIEKGADIESRDKQGRTPLLHAVQRLDFNETMINLLLDEGANIESSDSTGRTPLLWALHLGVSWIKIVCLLIKRGANTESRDPHGKTTLLLLLEILTQTVLMRTYKSEFQLAESTVLSLLDKGVDIGVADNQGRTPLSWAAETGNTQIISYLLEKGADINFTDNDGRTPLLHAIHGGFARVVDLLLEKGADPDSRDNAGKTALIHATQSGLCDVVDLLWKNGASIDLSDSDGRTPLSWAVEHGHEETVGLLLEKGADTNSRDNAGRTSLSWAVCPAGGAPNKRIVRFLLDKGASINVRDNLGRTPLTMITLKLFCSALGLGMQSLADSERENFEKVERLVTERGGTF